MPEPSRSSGAAARTPSTDRISVRANAWLKEEQKGAKPAKPAMAAPVLRLAQRLGITAEALAAKIPADTLRRLKNPVIEQRLPDGRVIFKHDFGIDERMLNTRDRTIQ
jgi:hypothetical protein